MTARQARWAILGTLALYGLVAGWFAAQRLPLPRLLDFAFMVLTAPLPYVWYFVDATERNFRRTTSLGGAVVAYTLLAIPYSLVRSRPRGRRAAAVLRFVGFVLLALVVLVAGEIVAVLAFQRG